VLTRACMQNILIIILSMGFIAHSPPNYASAAA
jgi:hypothetical protein